jgi:hypothetical protein
MGCYLRLRQADSLMEDAVQQRQTILLQGLLPSLRPRPGYLRALWQEEPVVTENSYMQHMSSTDGDQEPQTLADKLISWDGTGRMAANRWLLSGMQRYLNVPLEHVTARR